MSELTRVNAALKNTWVMTPVGRSLLGILRQNFILASSSPVSLAPSGSPAVES